MRDYYQTLCGCIRTHLKIIQLAQSFAVGSPGMETRSFQEVADLGPDIVVD